MHNIPNRAETDDQKFLPDWNHDLAWPPVAAPLLPLALFESPDPAWPHILVKRLRMLEMISRVEWPLGSPVILTVPPSFSITHRSGTDSSE